MKKHVPESIDNPSQSNYGWLSWLRDFLIFLVIFYLLFHFVLGISKVKGTSMMDTIESGKVVFFLRTVRNYQVGNVAAAEVPSGELYVKRIVAKGEDVVDIRDGRVYINGIAEENPHTKGKSYAFREGIDFPYEVPENSYFLMGDNREHSLDSRMFGAVSQDKMIGRLFGY